MARASGPVLRRQNRNARISVPNWNVLWWPRVWKSRLYEVSRKSPEGAVKPLPKVPRNEKALELTLRQNEQKTMRLPLCCRVTSQVIIIFGPSAQSRGHQILLKIKKCNSCDGVLLSIIIIICSLQIGKPDEYDVMFTCKIRSECIYPDSSPKSYAGLRVITSNWKPRELLSPSADNKSFICPKAFKAYFRHVVEEALQRYATKKYTPGRPTNNPQ